METAYILENNLRIREVKVIKEINGSCLIKLGEGSGFWLHKSRIYYNIGEAVQEIHKIHPELKMEKILPAEVYLLGKYNAVCNGL